MASTFCFNRQKEMKAILFPSYLTLNGVSLQTLEYINLIKRLA